jgi:hypothetical protein
MWLRNGTTGQVVLVVHADTITRCLGDGWTEISDPRISQDAPVAVPLPAPEPDAQPQKMGATTSRPKAREGRR